MVIPKRHAHPHVIPPLECGGFAERENVARTQTIPPPTSTDRDRIIDALPL